MNGPSPTIEPPRPERRRPELLAPAGDAECIQAAIENGADAVYFGLVDGWNARARASNFQLDAAAEILARLHRRGLRGYITLNTLIFSSELEAATRLVRELTRAGADAIIVQDLGFARLVREISPDLPIHASTQMTLTSAESIAVVQELGLRRIVLARELSIREIQLIRQATDIPLEVFVHGALCVAYSGQCLTSESLGGRSANRGQCAQACRLPYTLHADGRPVDLGSQRYLLSPKDLAGFDLIPDLLDAGVHGFKIEGRLKSPEYVANIVRHYRQAIDAALEGGRHRFPPSAIDEMELSFSRGFSQGWLSGPDHQALVDGQVPKKRGICIGEVHRWSGGQVWVMATRPLKRGDGVVFDSGNPEGEEEGGRLYDVQTDGSYRILSFAHGAIRFDRLRVGQRVWKTDDPALTVKLRATMRPGAGERRISLDVKVIARIGSPLRVVARGANDAQCEVISEGPLQPARKHAATRDWLVEQLSRLGNTAYCLRGLEADLDEGVMIPLSVLGQLRRAMVEQLDLAAIAIPARTIRDDLPALPALPIAQSQGDKDGDPSGEAMTATLWVLARSLAMVDWLVELGVRHWICDFPDPRDCRPAVLRAREVGARIRLATPRIQKPGEMGLFHAITKAMPDEVLVRNLAGIGFFRERGVPLIADFSLNAANAWTVDLLRQWEVDRVTPSYDLNRDQLFDLVDTTSPERLEIVIHQHMPMFHMEHCVFCAVLSEGTNHTNCGRPCEKHEVRLVDRVGMSHRLMADVGCRNTLFNGVPQSAAEIVADLLVRGIRHFRLELLDETRAEVGRILPLYTRLLRGELPGSAVWKQLRASNRVGVTRGTLEERRDPLAIL